jgi:hypothetical protein
MQCIASHSIICSFSFGNAHAVQKAFEARQLAWAERARQVEKYVKRVLKVRDTPNWGEEDKRAKQTKTQKGKKPRGLETGAEETLTAKDFIGPEPRDIQPHSQAWRQLSSLVGFEDVNNAVGRLLDLARTNHHREIAGLQPLQMTLNRVFIGPPGNAKLIAEAELLSLGGVIYTNS